MGSTTSSRAAAVVAATLQALIQGPVPAWAQENAAPPVQAPADSPGRAPAGTPAPETQASPPQSPEQENKTEDSRSGNHRYVFHHIENGVLRLDMQTGAVATCTAGGGGWNCVPAGDERAALDRQIAQLQRDNAALKNALLERGLPLPAGMTAAAAPGGSGQEAIPRPPQTVPPTGAAPGAPAQGTSGEDEIDHVIDAVQKGWRRLVEMMTNIQREWQKPD